MIFPARYAVQHLAPGYDWQTKDFVNTLEEVTGTPDKVRIIDTQEANILAPVRKVPKTRARWYGVDV